MKIFKFLEDPDFARSIRRFFHGNIPFIASTVVAICTILNPGLVKPFWEGLGSVSKLMFAVMFGMVQIVGIFWLISQTKTETILPGKKDGLTLKDYLGQPYLKQHMAEWVSLLQDPKEFTRRGGQMIRGILLKGDPGTGKTYLAQCIAGEAGIAFHSIEGSGFRGMFFGMDVLRMLSYIGKCNALARDYGVCIAYIDEIDAVAQNRGGVGGGAIPMMGGMGMMSGALTRLLSAMSGIESKVPWWARLLYGPKGTVLFMGATNRPDAIDPALLRPGRMDIHIQVDAPTREGRREVIQGYLNKILRGPSIDLESIVDDTGGWTPAKIVTAITKHAVRLSITHKHDFIEQSDIDQALRETEMGIDNPIDLNYDQRRVIAYHEASHAVASWRLMPEARITRVSIVRSGSGSLGHMAHVEKYELRIVALNQIVNYLKVTIASRAGELLFCGGPYASVGGDYQQAEHALGRLYMSGFWGPPIMDDKQRVAKMMRSWKKWEKELKTLLAESADHVHALAEALLQKENLSGAEVLAILEKK